MVYKYGFEKLDVWNDAINFVKTIHRTTKNFSLSEKFWFNLSNSKSCYLYSFEYRRGCFTQLNKRTDTIYRNSLRLFNGSILSIVRGSRLGILDF